MDLHTLVASLESANHAYHNGLPLTMSDTEYDTALDTLRSRQPQHPFLTKIGAPTIAGDEVALPVPLPSLNKIKANDDSLAKWLAAPTQTGVERFHVSTKLDGCSALWIPDQRRLYTRGDGVKGRDISVFAPLFKGCLTTSAAPAAAGLWIRGELIMRTDSPAVPTGKLARNIVAGALNRKAHEVDPVLFGQIHFVAYELVRPARKPTEAYACLRRAGFIVARTARVARADMTEEQLSGIFGVAEKCSEYQLDGIVVEPDVAVSSPSTENKNPIHRVAWKTRPAGSAQTAQTTVSTVEWNISHAGVLIPRVLLDPPVQLSGATIRAATGIHAAWIRDNVVGPGAVVEIRRSGDVIPQITAVIVPAPAGPALPSSAYVWDSVHIRPTDDSHAADSLCVQLTHALKELGTENVGPGVVARLVAAGFTTLRSIYAATPADFVGKVEGIKAAGAQRICEGLRVQGPPWKEIQLMKASCVFPRGIGERKLEPLLALNPTPATWNTATLVAAKPAGLSANTIESIVANIPAYIVWRTANFPDLVAASPHNPAVHSPAVHNPAVHSPAVHSPLVVVLTGFRDKALESALTIRGHQIADTVTKKTTHLVHPDGSTIGKTEKTGKASKAIELGIPTMSVSTFRALCGI
jgi:NAD-dependent DNA ligase